MDDESTPVENLPTLVYHHEYMNGNSFVSCSPRVSLTTEQITSVALLAYDKIKGWQVKEVKSYNNNCGNLDSIALDQTYNGTKF